MPSGTRARAARMHAIAHLGEHLERFETKLLANGAHVHWAETPAEANAIIAGIAKRTGAQGLPSRASRWCPRRRT